jgi:hypothetical protein
VSDPISQQLAAYSDFDEDESWDRWAARYVTQPPEYRVESLKIMDGWLAAQDGITREHASLVVKKRELESLHFALRRAGR